MEEIRREEKIKTSSAVWLGAANAGTGLLCAFAEGAAFQYLFVNKLGLDVNLNIIVWILFGVWNAINDPIYGFLADKTKSKLDDDNWNLLSPGTGTLLIKVNVKSTDSSSIDKETTNLIDVSLLFTNIE